MAFTGCCGLAGVLDAEELPLLLEARARRLALLAHVLLVFESPELEGTCCCLLRPLLGLGAAVVDVCCCAEAAAVGIGGAGAVGRTGCVGALEGLRRPPVVSFVWAARISGAIRAMSGSEFGADTAVAVGCGEDEPSGSRS